MEFLSATLQQVYSSVTGNPHQVTVKTSSQYKYIIAIVSVGFIICVVVAAFLCFVLKRRRSGGTCADTSHTQGRLNIFGIRSPRHQTISPPRIGLLNFTVRLLERGHLVEDHPITMFFEYNRFSVPFKFLRSELTEDAFHFNTKVPCFLTHLV